MAHIPIRSLTLYKQGIGYFQRRGLVDDTSVSLVVLRDGLNDVLKSLAIQVHSGEPIQSVDYETPADKSQALDSLPVKIGDRAALTDLLVSLRGSTISVQRADGTHVAGRVIGVESGMGLPDQSAALVLQHDDNLYVVPLLELRGLSIQDPRAANDVRFFLDLSQTEQTRTTLTLRLAPGSHDLELSYSAPSPTWRVSYRLTRTADGQARLVGWGLFDNTLDEDLENVELTLISGRPVSFTYELAEARIPSRPQVSDDPSTLEQAMGDRGRAEGISTIAHELRTPLTSITGTAELLSRDMVGALSDDQRALITRIRDNSRRIFDQLNGLFELARIRDSDNPIFSGYRYRAGPLGDLKVSGSYFLPVQMGNAEQEYLTYRVPTTVSVRRGQAAMVPIIDTQVQFESLCVYNGAKMSNHPLLVWRLQNTSGVALEQGPITLAADGRYLGEGLVRFTGVDDDLQIPYALEFGLLVDETREYSPRVLRDVRFNAEDRRAEVTWYHITRTRYSLASNVRRDTTLLIEHRDPQRGEFFEMAAPADAREGHTRWTLHVPARETAAIIIQEREARTSFEDVATWSATYVEELRAAGGMEDVAFGQLQALASIAQERTADQARRSTIDAELAQLLALQEQLRKNLGALGDSEREVALRNRLLDDLEASEERRRAIAIIRRDLEQQVQAQEIRQRALLDQIYGK